MKLRRWLCPVLPGEICHMFITHPQARVRFAQTRLVWEAAQFNHAQAVRVRRQVMEHDNAHRVVLDLSRAQDAETSAFAELILLRRALLRAGCDLRLTGLHDRAAGVYEVNRLMDVLPMV